jgi:hypothetical protein
MRTEMDVLVLNNYILDKEDQKELYKSQNWKEAFKPD